MFIKLNKCNNSYINFINRCHIHQCNNIKPVKWNRRNSRVKHPLSIQKQVYELKALVGASLKQVLTADGSYCFEFVMSLTAIPSLPVRMYYVFFIK